VAVAEDLTVEAVEEEDNLFFSRFINRKIKLKLT
jgi:hypothetical protein